MSTGGPPEPGKNSPRTATHILGGVGFLDFLKGAEFRARVWVGGRCSVDGFRRVFWAVDWSAFDDGILVGVQARRPTPMSGCWASASAQAEMGMTAVMSEHKNSNVCGMLAVKKMIRELSEWGPPDCSRPIVEMKPFRVLGDPFDCELRVVEKSVAKLLSSLLVVVPKCRSQVILNQAMKNNIVQNSLIAQVWP